MIYLFHSLCRLARRRLVWSGVLLLAGTGWVHGQFVFATNNGSLTITGYEGPGQNVSIPTQVGGLPVTSIGAWAFSSRALVPLVGQVTSITNVVIPGSITNIGNDAFYECTALAGVNLTNGLATLGTFAFAGCTELTGVAIPGTLASVGDGAFSGCTNLARLTLPDGLGSIGTEAFAGCTSLTNVAIPGSVASIGVAAFSACSGLKQVTLAPGVASLGAGAFQYCLGLAQVAIPGSVTNFAIWPSAEGGLVPVPGPPPMPSFLQTPGLPISEYYVPGAVFGGCMNLTNIAVDPSNAGYLSTNGVLYDKTRTQLVEYPGGKAGSYAIPSGVRSVANFAAEDCFRLTGLTLPAGLTNIGINAFAGCSDLPAAAIPGGAHVGADAFARCGKLAKLTMAEGVTVVDDLAFQSCTSLTSVTIPASVHKIGLAPFENCTALTSIAVESSNPNYVAVAGVLFDKAMTTVLECPAQQSGAYAVPGPVQIISAQAFSGCVRLTGVTLPRTVTTIQAQAFAGCAGLTTMTIPNSVTSVGLLAFFNCARLTSVAIGSGVTNLVSTNVPFGEPPLNGIFNSCPKLRSFSVDPGNPAYTSVDGVLFDKPMTELLDFPAGKSGPYAIPAGVQSIADEAFADCAGLTSLTIPNGVTNLGIGNFSNCSGLTNVNLGVGCTELEDDFYNCTNLASVTFQGNAPAVYGFFDGVLPTVYYYPGTSGWDFFSTFADVPVVMLNPPIPNGALAVAIEPYQAVNAGAQWRVDGGILQPAGATVEGLTVGLHTVGFTPLSGWITPANETVWVSSNATATVAGFYGLTGDDAFICSTNDDGTLTVIQYAGVGGDVAIPATIETRQVAAIGDQVFHGNAGLTAIAIPGSVTGIGPSAFGDCTNLVSVVLQPGLTNIGDGAFANCGALTNLIIPATVASLGSGAFQGCAGLTNLILPGGLQTIGDQAFEYCSGLTNVAIPDTVTNIGEAAFAECLSLTALTLPAGVVIGDSAFAGCPFGSITIPSGASVGDNAFQGCSSLTNAAISDGAKNIGAGAFSQTALVSVNVPASVAGIGAKAFAGCASLAAVNLANGIFCLGSNVFESCYSLPAFTIPASVTNLGPGLFLYCDSLTNIAVDPFNARYASAQGVLFDNAFGTVLACPNGKTGSFVIPASVTSIADAAFQNCYELLAVTIPPGVTNIGAAAFESCSSLKQVQIPASVGVIGPQAFRDCVSVTNFTVAALNPGYRSQDGALFDQSMSQLIQFPPARTGGYAIPPGVASIGAAAFEDAWLDSVSIPDGVAAIGDDAFDHCTKLAALEFPNSVATIGDGACFACTSLTNVVLPDALCEIGAEVFWGCSSLVSVTIPGSVTNLGTEAFGYCTQLQGIYFDGNAPGTAGTSLRIPDFPIVPIVPILPIPPTVVTRPVQPINAPITAAHAQLSSLTPLPLPPLPLGPSFYSDPFAGDSATVYYLPGTLGWTNAFAGLPTAFWFQPAPVILNPPANAARDRGFGLTVAWATNAAVVVEACTNLARPDWAPLQTNVLLNGTNAFADAAWTNYPARFYRVRTP